MDYTCEWGTMFNGTTPHFNSVPFHSTPFLFNSFHPISISFPFLHSIPFSFPSSHFRTKLYSLHSFSAFLSNFHFISFSLFHFLHLIPALSSTPYAIGAWITANCVGIVILDAAVGHTLVDIVVADPTCRDLVERAARQDSSSLHMRSGGRKPTIGNAQLGRN